MKTLPPIGLNTLGLTALMERLKDLFEVHGDVPVLVLLEDDTIVPVGDPGVKWDEEMKAVVVLNKVETRMN